MKKRHKLFEQTNRIASNKWFPLLFVPMSFVFVIIYSYTTSPLFVDEGIDSCIFKTMGLAILQGKTPYLDFFDHKGPILYFINAFGQFLIPGRQGIFFLQVLWMSFSLFFLYKLSSLFLRCDLSFVAVCATLVILTGLYQEGNQCEEWELLAISASYYFAARFLLSPDSRKLMLGSFVWGLSLGYVFFIRPNDAVSQIGAVFLGITAYLIYNKEYKNWFKCFLISTGGFLLVIIPVLLFFLTRNAIPDLIHGLLVFNAKYSEGITRLFITCFGRTKLCFFLLFVPIGCMIYNTTHRKLLFVLIPVFCLSLLLTGPRAYPHYYIPLIPIFLLFWTFLFLQNNKSWVLVSLSMLYCCSFGSSVSYIRRVKYETIDRINTIQKGDSSNAFYLEAGKLINLIPISERNDVWNYNLMNANKPDFTILYHYGIVQCNKVPIYPMYLIDERLEKEDNIRIKQPKWVLVSHNSYNDGGYTKDYDYINEHYTVVGATDSLNGNIELYHRLK